MVYWGMAKRTNASENRNPERRVASRARYLASEKGQAVSLRTQQNRLERHHAVAAQGDRQFTCPHCGGVLEGNSAFVLRKENVGASFRPEDYASNPDRAYKTPEGERRRQLAWYWRNREGVLQRAKQRRLDIKAKLAG